MNTRSKTRGLLFAQTLAFAMIVAGAIQASQDVFLILSGHPPDPGQITSATALLAAGLLGNIILGMLKELKEAVDELRHRGVEK